MTGAGGSGEGPVASWQEADVTVGAGHAGSVASREFSKTREGDTHQGEMTLAGGTVGATEHMEQGSKRCDSLTGARGPEWLRPKWTAGGAEQTHTSLLLWVTFSFVKDG